MFALLAGRLEGQAHQPGRHRRGRRWLGHRSARERRASTPTRVLRDHPPERERPEHRGQPADRRPGDIPYIDSVFIIDVTPLPINSELVEFSFDPGDTTANTWNHILSDLTHDVDKGINEVRAGGSVFSTGIGIHAPAGVTFNLEELRAVYGAETMKYFIAFAGSDGCGRWPSLSTRFSAMTQPSSRRRRSARSP